MKLHYMGKYNLDPDSLPHGEHKPGAVKFREAGDTAELSRIVSKYSLILLAVLMTVLLYRYRSIPSEQWLIGFVLFWPRYSRTSCCTHCAFVAMCTCTRICCKVCFSLSARRI